MRTWLVAIILIFSQPVFSAIRSFDIRNLHVNFLQNNGRATADTFNLIFNFGKFDFNGYDIDITKGEGNLLFAKDDTSFLLEGIDQSVLDAINALSAERIDVKGVANKSLNLDFKNGAISLGDEVHGLSALTVNCFTNTRGDDTLISFLIPCFDNGEAYIPEIQLSQKSAEAFMPIWESSPVTNLVPADKRSIFMPKKIEEIRLKIVEQQFELSLQARFIFKLTLRVKGTAVLNQKKDIAVFDIQDAKVGFINIKKLVIKLLSKLDVTNVTVEGSTITIKL